MAAQRLHTVTGATGYTGRYITQLLLQQGHRIQSITGHPQRENPFGDQVPLHPFNFDRPDLLRQTLVLQRRFLNLVSFWPEIASRKPRTQSCQARGQAAMERCSRPLSCEASL